MRRTVITMVILLGILYPSVTQASKLEPEMAMTCDASGAHTARLYRTLFGRVADKQGLVYWVGLRRAGLTGEEVAYWMTQGAEYHFLYQGLDDSEFLYAVYRNLLGRDADAAGHAYWLERVATEGRPTVTSWMIQAPEFARLWPFVHSAVCAKAERLGLTEVAPGIMAGKQGLTVTVLADRSFVRYSASDGGRTHASQISGDVVVNANWFVDSTAQAPVVSNGYLSGSSDVIERGQIVAYEPSCEDHGGYDMDHIWMGEIYSPGPCVLTAVSGISLVHKGVRADAYPGIDLTYGSTNTSWSHSFIGYNEAEIIIISSTSMNASKLADYAISLGATEGVMLDGGDSTQIKTPNAQIWSSRTVPAFAVLDSIVS